MPDPQHRTLLPVHNTTTAWQSDIRILVAMRGVRSFGYSLFSIALSIDLSLSGYTAAAIGSLITTALIGNMAGTYFVGLYADKWGRRRTMAILAIAMTATGLTYGITHAYFILWLAALIGPIGISTSETAPFLPIEQTMISQITLSSHSVRIFSWYNGISMIASALGALSFGALQRYAGMFLPKSGQLFAPFGIYAGLGIIVVMLITQLSAKVEPDERGHNRVSAGKWKFLPANEHDRGIILQLVGLFGTDAFAGGFIIQSVFALYFHLRYAASADTLGIVFFLANISSAISFFVAVPISKRVGLLNTMVFTHLPSNVLLILLAIIPNFPIAIIVLVLRQSLSQMDVPTRQAYTMVIVQPDSRLVAASATSLARSSGATISPLLASAILGSSVYVGMPLIIAGGLKIVYDLLIWRIFRKVPIHDRSSTI